MAIEQSFVNRCFSRLLVLVLHGVAVLIRLTPPALWGVLAGALARIFWLFCSSYRRNTLKNLVRTGRTLEEARNLGKLSFRSHLLGIFESLAMPRILARKGVRVEHRISPAAEEVFRKIRSGEEAMTLVVSGHMGVWEILGAELVRLCAPTTLFATFKVVKNPVLDGFLMHLRESFGFEVVSMQKSLRRLLEEARKESSGVYAFLCDQHFKGGVQLPFMGKTACTSNVPANLIAKYDWPVLFCRCIRVAPGNYLIECDLMDPSSFRNLPRDEAIRSIMMAINGYIEESVTKAPEQWTWGHKRWKNCCGPDARIIPWPTNYKPRKKKRTKSPAMAPH